MESSSSLYSDCLESFSLRKRQKTDENLRTSEIDKVLSESDSDVNSLFGGDDAFIDPDFL